MVNSLDIEKLKRTPLGDNEISSYLDGQVKILKYNEIPLYSNIPALLSPWNSVVILLETQQDFGHWICLKKTGDVISFFDSYGDFPDDQKKFVNSKFLKDSGQKYNIICKMLDEASYYCTIEFSDRRLQNMDDLSIATCGLWMLLGHRWCVVAVVVVLILVLRVLPGRRRGRRFSYSSRPRGRKLRFGKRRRW